MSYKHWFHLPILSLNLAGVFQSCFSHLKLDIKSTIFAARHITFWRHVNNIHGQLINEDSQQNYLARDSRHVPRLQ